MSFNQGDSFSSLVDFSISLTGLSVSAAMTSVVSGSQIIAFTTSVVNASAGQVNVSLTKTQTAALARGTYRWSLVWTDGSATRTALEGFVEVL